MTFENCGSHIQTNKAAWVVFPLIIHESFSRGDNFEPYNEVASQEQGCPT